LEKKLAETTTFCLEMAVLPLAKSNQTILVTTRPIQVLAFQIVATESKLDLKLATTIMLTLLMGALPHASKKPDGLVQEALQRQNQLAQLSAMTICS